MTDTVNRLPLGADSTFLVIGYGNPRQGDDAIGLKVVSQLKALKIPNVEAIGVNQLMPELSNKLAASNFACFVDACKLNHVGTINIKPIKPYGSEPAGSVVPAWGHSCDPASLLALTYSVYGHCPQAWWVEVPASDFKVGHHLSELAVSGIEEALHVIEALIDSRLQVQSQR
ncbi:MAG: hydrogenase maturation protease [Cyanobacteria bacterium P01_A01_bin.123]